MKIKIEDKDYNVLKFALEARKRNIEAYFKNGQIEGDTMFKVYTRELHSITRLLSDIKDAQK